MNAGDHNSIRLSENNSVIDRVEDPVLAKKNRIWIRGSVPQARGMNILDNFKGLILSIDF